MFAWVPQIFGARTACLTFVKEGGGKYAKAKFWMHSTYEGKGGNPKFQRRALLGS